VRLVDGTLPGVKVGSHRRLRAADIEAYRIKRDATRNEALDQLAALSGGHGRLPPSLTVHILKLDRSS
jgi:hypothetical protein